MTKRANISLLLAHGLYVGDSFKSHLGASVGRLGGIVKDLTRRLNDGDGHDQEDVRNGQNGKQAN